MNTPKKVSEFESIVLGYKVSGAAFNELQSHARQLETQVQELREALADLYAQGCGVPKSCGHEFYCVCPSDKARAILEKTK